MAYATTAQLAEYLGVAVGDLPGDAGRLLQRASEYVDQVTLGKAAQADLTEDQKTQRKLATCAQVEYWLEIGEGAAVAGVAQDIQIGTLRVHQGATNLQPETAPRAHRYLMMAGLLGRKVGMK